ncbi:MAG: GAF domain-containing SpoIIE family protein phosphatase [Planctomycetota bacterium]
MTGDGDTTSGSGDGLVGGRRAGAPMPAVRVTSVRDFWTDGSISALCELLTEMGGITIELRDESDRVLASGLDRDQVGVQRPIPDDSSVFPIAVQEQRIVSVVVHPGGDSGAHDRAARAGRLIASAAREMCADVTELRHRVAEIDTLYQLSFLLVRGGRARETLEAALRSALEVLDLDAGSIMLLPEDADGLARGDSEADLERSVAINLSEAWLDNPLPLSRDREFDRLALSGEVVFVEDLAADPRVLLPEQSVEEDVKSFMCAGMVFDGRPIGVIRVYSRRHRAFTRAERRLLRSIGQSAAASIEQARLIKMRARERRIQRALRIAGAVQQRMLPASVPTMPGIDLAARYRPSYEVGGDFYDLFHAHDRLVIVAGDVVGKGIAAGLLMSAVRATMRAHAEVSDDLAMVMERSNEAMCRDTTVSEFATAWMGSIGSDGAGGRELRYVSAGHDRPALFRRRSDGAWSHELLEAGGLVAGVMAGERYAIETLPLLTGDLLLVYTDGITDAGSFDGERFGRRRLLELVTGLLDTTPDVTAGGVVEHVFWGIRQFSGLHRQADDETLLAIRVQ